MSLLDKQKEQDICEYTALRARFICKRALDLYVNERQKEKEEDEEERKRMPNRDIFLLCAVRT